MLELHQEAPFDLRQQRRQQLAPAERLVWAGGRQVRASTASCLSLGQIADPLPPPPHFFFPSAGPTPSAAPAGHHPSSPPKRAGLTSPLRRLYRRVSAAAGRDGGLASLDRSLSERRWPFARSPSLSPSVRCVFSFCFRAPGSFLTSRNCSFLRVLCFS